MPEREANRPEREPKRISTVISGALYAHGIREPRGGASPPRWTPRQIKDTRCTSYRTAPRYSDQRDARTGVAPEAGDVVGARLSRIIACLTQQYPASRWCACKRHTF